MIDIGNNKYINSDVGDIINKLKTDLPDLFYKSVDTPNNYMICCPFHKDGHEKKPSMGIHKTTGVCHCFACDWVGNISEMISNIYGYDDFGKYGEKWLLHNFSSYEVDERSDLELDMERIRSNNNNGNRNNTLYITEEELDKYRYYHPYWKERKITDERIIELFDLGYDKKTDCITFPVRDINGNCLFVARRSVKTKYFNYPQGVEKPLYGLYELNNLHNKYKLYIYDKDVIVCESMLDALTCWQYGKVAVALNGLGNDLQFAQLRELPCRKLILATDMDEAGLKARRRINNTVGNKIITEYRWDLSIAKDINDMSKEMFDNLQEFMV